MWFQNWDIWKINCFLLAIQTIFDTLKKWRESVRICLVSTTNPFHPNQIKFPNKSCGYFFLVLNWFSLQPPCHAEPVWHKKSNVYFTTNSFVLSEVNIVERKPQVKRRPRFAVAMPYPKNGLPIPLVQSAKRDCTNIGKKSDPNEWNHDDGHFLSLIAVSIYQGPKLFIVMNHITKWSPFSSGPRVGKCGKYFFYRS